MLDNFSGPLDFLLHLIQKNEIDICSITLSKITDQYLEELKKLMDSSLDTGAEFIGVTASLMLWKSKSIVPNQEGPPLTEPAGDPKLELIQHLIEYCQFKELAKKLLEREDEQGCLFGRSIEDRPVQPKHLGIAHLSLEDLGKLFQQVLEKANTQKKFIHEEVWTVSDKITFIRHSLNDKNTICFHDLFSIDVCREELIVTFLALLELMKLGEAKVIIETEDKIVITYDKRN